MEEALEAASLHPAQLLGISRSKGTLDFGSHAGEFAFLAPFSGYRHFISITKLVNGGNKPLIAKHHVGTVAPERNCLKKSRSTVSEGNK